MKPFVITSPFEIVQKSLFYDLKNFLKDSRLFLKLEGLNQAGSIKMKPALEMIESLELEGKITPGKSHIVESSSGNMGVALSMVCKLKGYKFTCVSDKNINAVSKRHIELWGGRVIVIRKLGENGGYVHNRIRIIQKILKGDPYAIWLNQYSNQANVDAHYKQTAREIFESFPETDYLFVGTGTTGTLMGCAKYARQFSPRTRVVAVDVVGSVIFGGPPGKRYLPGLGCSRKPEIVDLDMIDEVVMVPESDAIRMSYRILEQYQLLLGGAAGTVLAGLKSYAGKIGANKCVVCISPDFGERYFDNLYNKRWLAKHFPLLDINSLLPKKPWRCEQETTLAD